MSIGVDNIKNYFKGYYFKCGMNDDSIAFIPALHKNGKEKKASLQVVTKNKTWFISYQDIYFNDKEFVTQVGSNIFSKNQIFLNIDEVDLRIQGKLKLGDFKEIKYDIMGPFKYVPHMQCRHSIISMKHLVNGEITINDKTYCFNDGVGYIEGDRGSSFPKEYIWTQCNYNNHSISLSVADIPLSGKHFKGIIGIVLIDDLEYRIATYLGAIVISLSEDMVEVKQGKYTLKAKLIDSCNKELKAPIEGDMNRTIHESIVSKAYYQFIEDDKILLEFTSDNASFEFEFNK